MLLFSLTVAGQKGTSNVRNFSRTDPQHSWPLSAPLHSVPRGCGRWAETTTRWVWFAMCIIRARTRGRAQSVLFMFSVALALTIMASTALGVLLLLSQATNFATESSFRDSDIVPDMISTAPSTQAKVSHWHNCRPERHYLERKTLPNFVPVVLYICKSSITHDNIMQTSCTNMYRLSSLSLCE